MEGVKKLEKQNILNFLTGPDGLPPALASQNNLFLIDWLTFVAHGDTVEYLKWLLGLDSPSIPWETTEKFRNGYPLQTYWNGITISYGADDERFYKDPTKVRRDMGICVNLSGKGCRAFETYGSGDWNRLFSYLCRDTDVIAREHLQFKRYNITRLDIAYDDHIGLLDMQQLERDTRERSYVSRAKYAEVIWSDRQEEDIQGMTIQVGSDKSDIKIRIYDKAAERGFKGQHWIRCEIQIRDKRAKTAVEHIQHHGHLCDTASGILRNYLTYRIPTEDSNKSRWPIAPYWERLLLNMEKLSLWAKPGEEYNISKTEYWLCKQYGQAIVVLSQLEDPDYLVDKCRELYPVEDLAPKYKRYLADIKPRTEPGQWFDVLDEKTPFDKE